VLDADSHGTPLHDLASMFTDPWCIIGDFNDLLLSEDKRGGYECLSWLYNDFITWLVIVP
jgi:hypothetical protein